VSLVDGRRALRNARDDAGRRPPTSMGVASSIAMGVIDASPAVTFDEAECRALVGDDFDADAWRAAPKDGEGRVSKRTVLQHLGWPSEVFDGISGTREEARAVNDAAEAAAQGTPNFYDLTPDAVREARRASYVHSSTREDFTVHNAGDDENVTLTFAAWRPSTDEGPSETNKGTVPRAVYLLFHGGGWVFGDAAGQNDERLERVANELSIAVVVPDYRKAPENPYPAPLDDCEAAASWCEKHARNYFRLPEETPLVLGGESAGGNLCAATLLRRRDAALRGPSESKTRWAFVNFVYGIYDLRGTPSVHRFGDRRLVETTRDVLYFGDCYCPDVSIRDSPDVSPLRGDVSRCPPAAFTVGTEDALVDDSVLMYEKWIAAGNRATLDVWPEGPHGIGHFGIHANTKLGKACRSKIHSRMRTFLESFDERAPRALDATSDSFDVI
jgi:acetyl esterase/lipase